MPAFIPIADHPDGASALRTSVARALDGQVTGAEVTSPARGAN
jgi:hypothetical protein